MNARPLAAAALLLAIAPLSFGKELEDPDTRCTKEEHAAVLSALEAAASRTGTVAKRIKYSGEEQSQIDKKARTAKQWKDIFKVDLAKAEPMKISGSVISYSGEELAVKALEAMAGILWRAAKEYKDPPWSEKDDNPEKDPKKFRKPLVQCYNPENERDLKYCKEFIGFHSTATNASDYGIRLCPEVFSSQREAGARTVDTSAEAAEKRVRTSIHEVAHRVGMVEKKEDYGCPIFDCTSSCEMDGTEHQYSAQNWAQFTACVTNNYDSPEVVEASPPSKSK